MMIVNGIQNDITNITLTEYLKEHNYDESKVAVERNGQIVPKSQYKETILQSEDQIEIVSFVGGG